MLIDETCLLALKHMVNFNIPILNIYSNTCIGTFRTLTRRVYHAAHTALCDTSFQAISIVECKILHHEQYE